MDRYGHLSLEYFVDLLRRGGQWRGAGGGGSVRRAPRIHTCRKMGDPCMLYILREGYVCFGMALLVVFGGTACLVATGDSYRGLAFSLWVCNGDLLYLNVFASTSVGNLSRSLVLPLWNWCLFLRHVVVVLAETV